MLDAKTLNEMYNNTPKQSRQAKAGRLSKINRPEFETLLLSGLYSYQIAKALRISEETIRRYCHNNYDKSFIELYRALKS